MEAVTHWDDLQVDHHELGPMNARWRTADGVRVGMSRIDAALESLLGGVGRSRP